MGFLSKSAFAVCKTWHTSRISGPPAHGLPTLELAKEMMQSKRLRVSSELPASQRKDIGKKLRLELMLEWLRTDEKELWLSLRLPDFSTCESLK